MIQERCSSPRAAFVTACAVIVAGLLVATPALAQSESLLKIPGYVDGSPLVEIAGDDAVTVQVSIHGALLKALTRFNADLAKLIGGLESIQAVILEVPGDEKADRVKKMMLKTQRSLIGRGWQQLAVVREAGSQVSVLVLNDEETIQGLVVMVTDSESNEIVFTNVAGVIDLAALSAIGESLDIPGLGDLGVEEP